MLRWREIIEQAMKDYTASTGKVIYRCNLNDLNTYLKIVFDAYEFYGLHNEELESICDPLESFLFDEYAISDMYNDELDDYDFEKHFHGQNLDFALGLIIAHIFSSFYMAYNFTKYDLPTVRACLDTPYEKRKEAKEKIELYFWTKDLDNGPFFIKFFRLIYGLWENPEENLVVYSYRDREDDKKNYALKIGLKKMLDIVTNAKLVKKAIPYGIIYEAFSQDDKWLFSIVNEIGNNRNESGKRIYDSHILTDDVELRELLSLFLDVQVGGYLEEFKGYEVYAYGKMNVVNGSRIATDETLLLKNSEVFSSIRKVYTSETYWREG